MAYLLEYSRTERSHSGLVRLLGKQVCGAICIESSNLSLSAIAMKLIYATLNNHDEARAIGRELLSANLANCVNLFPITCIYKYKGEVTEEPEVVLIVKTKDQCYNEVEKAIKKHIGYENFIGQLNVEKVNDEFTAWLNEVVK